MLPGKRGLPEGCSDRASDALATIGLARNPPDGVAQ